MKFFLEWVEQLDEPQDKDFIRVGGDLINKKQILYIEEDYGRKGGHYIRFSSGEQLYLSSNEHTKLLEEL